MNKYTVFYENSIFTYRIWAANYAEALRTANRVINEGANTVTRYKDRRGREYYSASQPKCTVKLNGHRSLEIPVLADNYTDAVQQVIRIWLDATRDAIRL